MKLPVRLSIPAVRRRSVSFNLYGDVEYLETYRSGRYLYIDLVAFLFAEQGLGDGGAYRKLAGFQVGLFFRYYRVLDLFVRGVV